KTISIAVLNRESSSLASQAAESQSCSRWQVTTGRRWPSGTGRGRRSVGVSL
ncbi:hypothetical protein TIFTF001_052263, partial [Ficus carica]